MGEGEGNNEYTKEDIESNRTPEEASILAVGTNQPHKHNFTF